jgi:hypothetical protein
VSESYAYPELDTMNLNNTLSRVPAESAWLKKVITGQKIVWLVPDDHFIYADAKTARKDSRNYFRDCGAKTVANSISASSMRGQVLIHFDSIQMVV